MLWSWGAPIEWASRKQKSQALSSCEAEYMAASNLTQSVIWARRLFTDFGYEDLSIFDPTAAPTEQEMEGALPTVVYEDNTGCIEWSKNPVDHARAKHIDLKYHFIRAKVNGERHQVTLYAVACLALLLAQQGRTEEAATVYADALQGAPLGPQIPEAKANVAELSRLLDERGDGGAAAQLRQRFGCE